MLFNKVLILYWGVCVYICKCSLYIEQHLKAVVGNEKLPVDAAKRGSYITNSSHKFHTKQHFYSKIHVFPGEQPGIKLPNPKVYNERQMLERVKGWYTAERDVLSSSSPNVWMSDSAA